MKQPFRGVAVAISRRNHGRCDILSNILSNVYSSYVFEKCLDISHQQFADSSIHGTHHTISRCKVTGPKALWTQHEQRREPLLAAPRTLPPTIEWSVLDLRTRPPAPRMRCTAVISSRPVRMLKTRPCSTRFAGSLRCPFRHSRGSTRLHGWFRLRRHSSTEEFSAASSEEEEEEETLEKDSTFVDDGPLRSDHGAPHPGRRRPRTEIQDRPFYRRRQCSLPLIGVVIEERVCGEPCSEEWFRRVDTE
jgi:hypothetical protein